MKKLFDSVVFQNDAMTNPLRKIQYSVQDGQENKPYLHLVVSTSSEDEKPNDTVLDISREDMVEIINDIVDEWPEIVDFHKAQVKDGVEVIPVFSE